MRSLHLKMVLSVFIALVPTISAVLHERFLVDGFSLIHAIQYSDIILFAGISFNLLTMDNATSMFFSRELVKRQLPSALFLSGVILGILTFIVIFIYYSYFVSIALPTDDDHIVERYWSVPLESAGFTLVAFFGFFLTSIELSVHEQRFSPAGWERDPS